MKPLQALSLLQNLYTGVIWVAEDLTIQWVNSQTEQLLSVSKSRLIGLSILDLLIPTMSEAKVITADSASLNPSVNLQAQHSENKSCVEDSRDKLERQFHNAKEYLQPFIEYRRYIRGGPHP